MSYPRMIRPLVIEDDSGPRKFYEEVFDARRQSGVAIAPTSYAYCCEHACRFLESGTIFHLVILDLKLPQRAHEPPPEGIDLGLGVLRQCLERHDYPIPALMVVSAHIDTTDQTDLEHRVNAGFAYGAVRIKSTRLTQDINDAIDGVLAYCDVGIHLQDACEERWPTLSPREEDLLRRCILSRNAVGADLEWWASDYQPPSGASSAFRAQAGWTKVLSGRLILDKGRGHSRRTFFKLAPADGAELVIADARLMEEKLPHIKVLDDRIAGGRSLLVTQTVNDDDTRPLSLAEVLEFPVEKAEQILPIVAGQIVEQVRRLGDLLPAEGELCSLLWAYHDETRLTGVWEKWKGPSRCQSDPLGDAIALFRHLHSNKTPVFYNRQSVLHGDLNFTNVALSLRKEGSDANGYIFDASGAKGGVSVRDIATLEVTALLHRDPENGEADLVSLYGDLYGTWIVPPTPLRVPNGSKLATNTYRLIAELRTCALNNSTPDIYALMVFDAALQQLGGLAFTVSRNKIGSPIDAVDLCFVVARWLHRVVPQFTPLATGAPTDGAPK